jgi:hypothetical protein
MKYIVSHHQIENLIFRWDGDAVLRSGLYFLEDLLISK